MNSPWKRSPVVFGLALALLATPQATRAAAAEDEENDDDEEEDGPVNPYDQAPLADPALRTHGWIALFTGAGLLAAGAVTGGIALYLNDDLRSDCAAGVCPPSRQDDLESRDALATSSTLLIAAGFACSMMGILILTAFASDVETGAPDAEDGAQARLTPRLRFGLGPAALEVRF